MFQVWVQSLREEADDYSLSLGYPRTLVFQPWPCDASDSDHLLLAALVI